MARRPTDRKWAVERIFAQQQVSTAMGTAQAAGVVALAAAQHDVPVRFHTPMR